MGKVAPPIPTIPAFFTISTISSTVRASGSAGAFTSSLTVFWKSFSITTDTMSPPMEKGRGSMAFTVPETLAWMGAPKPLEFADFLTHLYLVAYFYDRGAGCAKVHRHGDDHGSRGCQLLDGLFIGCGLHIMGMNAAKESLCHCLFAQAHPLFLVNLHIFLPTTPAVAVPPLPLLSFFRVCYDEAYLSEVSPQSGLSAGAANGGSFL